MHHQRIPVCWCSDQPLDRDTTARAATVLDDDLLSEPAGEPLSDHTGVEIIVVADVGGDDAYRFRRIVFAAGRMRSEDGGRSQRGYGRSKWFKHAWCLLPMDWAASVEHCVAGVRVEH